MTTETHENSEAMTNSEPRDARASAVAAAALVFGLAAPATYTAERLYEYLREPMTSPVLILRTLHTVYFWRAGVAVWCGLLVAAIAYAHFRRAPERGEARARRLALATVIVVPLLALAAWVFP